MKTDIYFNESVKKIHNFWNHIHYHPTDSIEDDWGKAIIDRIAEDGVAKTIRIYTMFEDIVSIDDKGELIYDFTLNDLRMDYLVKKGFNLFVGYNFIPPVIAKNPEQVSESERYKGKTICNSQPSDYTLWQKICRDYTQHIVDRYGIDLVSSWRMQCYNEPDLTRYWKPDGDDCTEEKQQTEYNKLYDHFAAGVKSVSGKISIGGPSIAGKKGFLDAFFTHITKEKNYVTGKIGTDLDFFSIHTYGIGMKGLNAGDEFRSDSTLNATLEYHEKAKRYGLGEKEIIVDEWGLCSTGFKDMTSCPKFEFRNSEFYSAHFAKLICDYVKADAPVEKMLMCVCGQYNLKKDFMGYRSLFTLNMFPKPIYNAYVLAAKLGNTLVNCTPSPENTGIFPTIDSEGKITIMAYHTDDDMENTSEDVSLTLCLKDLSGVYKMTKYCIDKTHCNSYTKYKELGSPYNPDQWEREIIGQAGKIRPMENAKGVSINGDYDIPLTLTNDSMYLIELTPVK